MVWQNCAMYTPAWQKSAAIEYVGIPGVTQPCIEGVTRLIQCRVDISRVRILTSKRDHALLLSTGVADDLVAVKSGFASGYMGEGPSGLSYVLQLLEHHGAEIDEYKVTQGFMERLDYSALTQRDINHIEKSRPLRPRRWHGYIMERDFQQAEQGTLWQDWIPVLPLALIDARIADLALTFWEDPDARLMTGYRRLEERVRERSGSKAHGSKLFSEIFMTDPPKLQWPGVDTAEQKGRGQLFVATFAAHRNRRAHRETVLISEEHTSEFLVLNHLFRLESAAEPV